MKRIVEMFFVLVVIWLCLTLNGCMTAKGIAHDLAWGFDKVDKSIVVPE